MSGPWELADEQRCRQVLAEGRRCGGRRLKGAELCRWHQPGQARPRRRRPKRLPEAAVVELLAASELQYADVGELRALLGRTLARLEQGQIRPSVAYAIGYLAQALQQLPLPREPRKRWEELTPEEQEQRRREMRRQVRQIYGWTDEELDRQP
ncbi:MAG: hypothetical protein HY653_00620 [Acidobacteria bacterium]|nr:hypothetical protein [Acidobacteriota bacterium]